MMVGLTGRFEFIWLVLGGMAHVYYVVLRFPKGWPRLLALLPLLPFYLVVPWRAPTPTERALQSFFFLWLGAFKLVLLAYGIGPAQDPWTMSSFPRFLTGMSFSLHVHSNAASASASASPSPAISSSKNSSEDNGEISSSSQGSLQSKGGYRNGLVSRKSGAQGNGSGTAKEINEKGGYDVSKEKSMPNWMHDLMNSQDWKVVLLRCLFYFVTIGFWLQMYLGQAQIPTFVLYSSYSVLLYLGVLFAFELPAAVAASVFGVHLPAQFNMPFLATSLADFWGRRWNLLVNNLLRVSVYNPILLGFGRGQSGKRSSQKERAIASLAAFTVSAIMHEMIFFYMSRREPTFEVSMFFVLNGVATVFEGWCKRKLFNPPELVRRVITLSFLLVTSAWLFYPPLVRYGSDKRSIEDLNKFICWVRDGVFDTLRRPFSLLV
ncbi:hypothetical protein Mapa_003545 [Marchantia paleacea]|nr:hypothetical protein Mapa_003545 [Marchantia paleacea]